MSQELDELYQDLILDHFKNPRCKGCLEHPDASADVVNPLCGDQISLTICTRDKKIEDILFSGKGCSISQASASMMADTCKGLSTAQVKELILKFRGFMRGEFSVGQLEEVGGDLVALQGVRKFTARIKCALLAWDALGKCLNEIDPKE